MKIQKLKRKLDFIYTNQYLDNNSFFVFHDLNNSSLIDYKHLSKNLVLGSNFLNVFLYKHPLYVANNRESEFSNKVVFFKIQCFIFKNIKLFNFYFENTFTRIQKFLYYYLLFFLFLFKRKNG